MSLSLFCFEQPGYYLFDWKMFDPTVWRLGYVLATGESEVQGLLPKWPENRFWKNPPFSHPSDYFTDLEAQSFFPVHFFLVIKRKSSEIDSASCNSQENSYISSVMKTCLQVHWKSSLKQPLQIRPTGAKVRNLFIWSCIYFTLLR